MFDRKNSLYTRHDQLCYCSVAIILYLKGPFPDFRPFPFLTRSAPPPQTDALDARAQIVDKAGCVALQWVSGTPSLLLSPRGVLSGSVATTHLSPSSFWNHYALTVHENFPIKTPDFIGLHT